MSGSPARLLASGVGSPSRSKASGGWGVRREEREKVQEREQGQEKKPSSQGGREEEDTTCYAKREGVNVEQ